MPRGRPRTFDLDAVSRTPSGRPTFRKLVDAGIRRAAMEGVCQQQHSQFISERGYAYCPWCGVQLYYKRHCDTCGRDFVSEKAWVVHYGEHLRYRDNPCGNNPAHPVQWLKNRRVFYCPACNIEYPERQDSSDDDDRPVDTRGRGRTQTTTKEHETP